MKTRLSPFVAGMATMALIGSLGVSALAATGAFSITVNPINIQVNGETFAPKDATGADVPVFTYNGTTYAPLRALAEAYGLDVGYDAGANMATVGAKAAEATPAPGVTDYAFDFTYEEFLGLWDIEKDSSGMVLYFYPQNADMVSAWWKAVGPEARTSFLIEVSKEKLPEFDMAPNLKCTFGFRTPLGPEGFLASVWANEVRY